MASIGDFAVRGPAERRRTAAAGFVDGVVSLVVTMLVWPFPLMRAAVHPALHVLAVLAALGAVDVVYRTVSVRLWSRTPLMYLYDLGIEGGGPVTTAGALAWAAGWTLAYLPGLLGARALLDPSSGLPARLSGLTTRSTR